MFLHNMLTFITLQDAVTPVVTEKNNLVSLWLSQFWTWTIRCLYALMRNDSGLVYGLYYGLFFNSRVLWVSFDWPGRNYVRRELQHFFAIIYLEWDVPGDLAGRFRVWQKTLVLPSKVIPGSSFCSLHHLTYNIENAYNGCFEYFCTYRHASTK